jgi:DNA-binding PadR family transcriptional regulator
MSQGRAAEREAQRHDQRSRGGEQAPMRSPVNWAVLGLLIERSTYAYDLAQRFERRYGDALQLSNIGHVYTALGALEGRRLIEEIAGSREGRQPKPHYRATAAGAQAYRSWLAEQAREEARRRRVFVLALGALAADPDAVIDVLGQCEREWLREGMATSIPRAGARAELLASLIEEEERLAVGAKLEWLQYARERLEARR